VRSDKGEEYYDKYTENGQDRVPLQIFFKNIRLLSNTLNLVFHFRIMLQKEGTKHY